MTTAQRLEESGKYLENGLSEEQQQIIVHLRTEPTEQERLDEQAIIDQVRKDQQAAMKHEPPVAPQAASPSSLRW